MSHHPAALMVLCADDPRLSLLPIDTFLTQQSLPVFGGVFPGLLYQGVVRNRGVIIAGLAQDVQVQLIRDLSKQTTPQFTLDHDAQSSSAIMVLVDGLARNIDHYLQHLFNQVGNAKRVVGGGAGSLSFMQKPCLFCNEGISEDAMLIITLSNNIELAIAHGWEKLAGPYLANAVDDNVVEQLNFQPALTLYQEVVEQYSGMLFSQHEFFDIAKTYPFGIERLDDEVLVRDPITCQLTSMVCVGKIPENTLVYILKGNADSLISASIEVIQTIKKELAKTHSIGDGFLFDCISRQLFLQDRFIEELNGISHIVDAENPIFGVLVLGEIASGKSGAINFHNKTAVTVLSCEQMDDKN
jgi:hypothetical protein